MDEYLEEHRTDLIAQNPIHILRRHRRVRRTHLAVPVRVLCDIRPVRNIRRPFEQSRAHRIHLIAQACGQNGEPEHLNEADVLLLDVMHLGVRVKEPERMLCRRPIVAEHEIELKVLAAPPRNRGNRIVRRAVRLRENLHRRIAVDAPCRKNLLREVDERIRIR